MNNLSAEHTFKPATPNIFGSQLYNVPIKITKVNNDGTVQGYYDVDKMTFGQKLAALCY